MNGSEKCTNWLAHGSQDDVFYSLEEQAKLCKVNSMEDARVQREHICFGHRTVQRTNSGWIEYYCSGPIAIG